MVGRRRRPGDAQWRELGLTHAHKHAPSGSSARTARRHPVGPLQPGRQPPGVLVTRASTAAVPNDCEAGRAGVHAHASGLRRPTPPGRAARRGRSTASRPRIDETKDPRLLATARTRRRASCSIACPQTASPGTTSTTRASTSATATPRRPRSIAGGLLTLADTAPDQARAARLSRARPSASCSRSSTATSRRSPPATTTPPGVLRHGSSTRPHGRACSTYGDYYLVRDAAAPRRQADVFALVAQPVERAREGPDDERSSAAAHERRKTGESLLRF